jgi:hypothetical protein
MAGRLRGRRHSPCDLIHILTHIFRWWPEGVRDYWHWISAAAGLAHRSKQHLYSINLVGTLPASTFTYSTPPPPCGNQVSARFVFVFPDILNLSPLTLTAQACFPA